MTGADPDPLAAAEADAGARLRLGIEQTLQEQAEQMVRAGVARRWDKPPRVLVYRTFRLMVSVPRLRTGDGQLIYPPLYWELKDRGRQPLDSAMVAGATARRAESSLRAASGAQPLRGASKTRLQARRQEHAEGAAHEINRRWLGDKDIVAAYLDLTGTGFADAGIGHRRVVVAVGVTAEGEKVALGVEAGSTERFEVILPLLDGLAARGLDPRHVLWVVDQGRGIRKALEVVATRLAGRRVSAAELWIQHCTVHQARNVYDSLHKDGKALVPEKERTSAWAESEEALEQAVRTRLWDAWRSGDADEALGKLRALADELELDGRPAAADSLRRGLDETLTVIRLGLTGDLRTQLWSTNPIESVNRSLRKDRRDVTLFEDDRAVVRWAAESLLRQEQFEWSRHSDPPQLVAMAERIAPGRLDATALLARMPPLLDVERVVSPVEDERAAAAAVSASLRRPHRAVWIGSALALDAYGVRAGTEATPEQLTRALLGRHARSNALVRAPAKGHVERHGPDGGEVWEQIDVVEAMRWTLRPPPGFVQRWHEARDDRERLELGDALMAAAEQAVARVTRKAQRGGFAATAMLAVVTDQATGSSGPQVEGFVVGVRGGRGPIRKPAGESYRRREWRAAEDVAAEVLEQRLGLGRSARAHERVGPPGERRSTSAAGVPARERGSDYLSRCRGLLGSRRAGDIDRRAAELVSVLRARSDDEAWFQARRQELGDPIASLRGAFAIGARRTLTLEQDRRVHRQRDARGTLERLSAEELRLKDEGVHLDQWLSARSPLAVEGEEVTNAERIARLTALERVAGERGFALETTAGKEPTVERVQPAGHARDGAARSGAEAGLEP